MRRFFTLFSILGLLSAACGQSANPLSPSANPLSESSLRRVVDDVSGGNVGVCSPLLCAPISGETALTSGVGTLTATYGTAGATGVQSVTDPRDFTVVATAMTASGHLADETLALFVLNVESATATVSVNMDGPNGRYFLSEGTGEPAFAVTADTTCASGQRIETTLALNLEHLGRTQIVDNHCIR